MANGLLAQYTPTVTKHTNLRLGTGASSTSTYFPIYSCPGSTLTSGTLRIANDTGAAASVDVAIVEYTDALQLDVPGNQPSGTYFSDYSLNGNATSFVIEGSTWNSVGFAPDEVVTWTNTNIVNPATGNNTHTGKVRRWDQGTTKLWLYDMSHPLAFQAAVPTDTTFTGAGGGIIYAGPSYAGTAITTGFEGLIRYYDATSGVVYLNNPETANNLDFQRLGALGGGATGERRSSLNGACYVTVTHTNLKLAPWANTVNRYNAVTGALTTPATEIVDDNGVELLVTSVASVKADNYIVRQKSVSDNATLEVTGIVLGQYQHLYVACSAAVNCSFVGFEEAISVTPY